MFNAYIMLSPFVLIVVVVGELVRLGCSLSSLLLSIVTNVVSPHRVVGCTIGAENKSVKFFFKFFFRGVWALGCGRSGVGAWVWGRGCGRSGR